MRHIFLFAAAIALTACGGHSHDHAGEGIEISNAVINPPMQLGDEAVLTLDFEKADDLTIVAPIEQRGAKPKGDAEHGSHSGH